MSYNLELNINLDRYYLIDFEEKVNKKKKLN